jgi:hypothetical protein
MSAADTDRDARAAEAILAAAWGGPVRLGSGTALRERDTIARFPVVAAPPGRPASVVVKGATPRDDDPYDPDATDPNSQAVRLFNDWAGLALVQAVGGRPALVPRLYGGDRAQGRIVLEDLGAGPGLDHLLLGDDPVAAAAGLRALATALGHLHARTIGQQARYERLRRDLGHPTPAQFHSYDGLAATLAEATTLLAVDPAPGTEADVARVGAAMRDPGPFLAYTHGDPCPDNWLLTPDGVRLLDFEFGAYRHALVDGVYGRVHFPTCWCVNRLPPALPLEMEAAYRAALVPGCPAAADDRLFSQAVVEACAYWAINTIGMYGLARLLRADIAWGVATVRQRALLRFDLVARLTAERGTLEALGTTFARIAAALQTRWPEVAPLPLYPAFRAAL